MQGNDSESLPRRTAVPKRLYSPIVLDLAVDEAVGTDRHDSTAFPRLGITRFRRLEKDPSLCSSRE